MALSHDDEDEVRGAYNSAPISRPGAGDCKTGRARSNGLPPMRAGGDTLAVPTSRRRSRPRKPLRRRICRPHCGRRVAEMNPVAEDYEPSRLFLNSALISLSSKIRPMA